MSVSGRYINFLLLLVAIAVGSVIIAQLFWINNAYNFQEKNFRFKVQQAVEQTTGFIEMNYGCFEVSNKVILNEKEDLVILHRQLNDNKPLLPDTIRQYSTSFNHDSLVAVSFTSPFPLTAEILIKYHYTPLDSGYDISSGNIHNTYKRIDKKEKDRIFTGTHPVTYFKGGNFFRSYIDSILGVYLRQKDIHSPYYFLLKDEKNDSILLRSFADTGLLNNSNPFTAKLYSNSYFFSPQKLYLWIPRESSYLLGQMWLILAGSFIVLVLLGWVATAMAITLVRQKKLSEMKNDFINNMTHEFKTPIANIALAVDTIDNLKLINGNANMTKYLSIIGSENYRLQENVEKILQISMMNREQVSLKMENICINELMAGVIKSFNMMVESKGGRIDLQVETGNTILAGDKLHLENVFYNLIDNALKYNKSNPVIRITITDHVSNLKISIADNGIGIAQTELEGIFSRFYRVSTGNTHDVKGFGLGLSYVKVITEIHGGEVKVRSSEGNGSEFIVFLPRESITRSSKNKRKAMNQW